MKKYIHIALKVAFSIILVLPILGVIGVFPPATADLYSNAQAFAFIDMLARTQYIMIMLAVAHVLALICLWTKREALAALLVLPIALNVVGFHLVLDGGLLTAGAMLGNVFLAINLYLLYKNRAVYKSLLKP